MNNINRKAREQKNNIIGEIHDHCILLESREIFLHADFWSEEDRGTDFRMANRFLKNIRLLENINKDPIVVHQHSLGGEWDAGMIMYDAILHSPCHIILIMHGSACSMGSIIPQSADTRIIMPNCVFLIHTGYTGISGHTYKQSQSWAEMERHQTNSMLDIYVEASAKGSFFVENKMDDKKRRKFFNNQMDQKEDVWWFAEDVVKYGLADHVIGNKGWENIDIVRENILNGKL